jgi:hypothetical protein
VPKLYVLFIVLLPTKEIEHDRTGFQYGSSMMIFPIVFRCLIVCFSIFFGGGDFKDILGEASPSHVFLAVMYVGLGPGLGEKSLNTDNIMQTYTQI